MASDEGRLVPERIGITAAGSPLGVVDATELTVALSRRMCDIAAISLAWTLKAIMI